VQEIAASEATYVVVQGGTMDGQNCRSPQGVWQPFAQTWESNRSVRLENTGMTDVVNPWLSNGRNGFRSLKEIVARVVKPGMSDREIAMALWWQEIQHRFHYEGDNQELLSPVKVFNVYGHNTCGNDSICLAGQWKQAGLKVAPARVVGHCVTQVYYDGSWHLFDGDMHSMYLLRDNETVAGEQDIVRDHDLVRRTHTQGILEPQRRAGDEWASSVYVFEAEVAGDRNADAAPDMNMMLRPGEALVWRWGHVDPVKYHGNSPPRFPDRICNGLWEYRPDFTRDVWRQGAATVENIRVGDGGLAAEPGQTGTIIWKLHSPYVFVGGKLDIDATDVRFAISWDGESWEDVVEGRTGSPSVPTEGPHQNGRTTSPSYILSLDDKFAPQGPARYAYYLRCQLTGAARLGQLAIINDLQMAPLTLPGMAVGQNTFVYSDQSPADRQVRLTHEWVERSASRPPAAPPQPVYPPDGGDAEGTDVVFEWQPPADRDGDMIADYHFELSSYSDMRYPLSMTFARLISRTPDAGQPRFTLTPAGQLNPDQPYYWHVRARDSQGVWGPWSDTWRFTPRGPGVPLGVALEFDSTQGVLRWKPNPHGRAPTVYRVYGSDEKGFSVSDEPYPVSIGISKELPETFAANFVAEVRTRELPVVGFDVASGSVGRPATTAWVNKAFYRVVAVDAAGRRSGPSDYAAAPRPFIFSRPPATATVGKEFDYLVSTIRSLGDLRMRMVDGQETTNFWDIERPRYRLERGPSWLTIDEATGQMRGMPDTAGKAEVIVDVTLERELRRLDGEALKWGVEKVAEAGVETVGSARQRLVLEVCGGK
jgi:hypothetical protein